MRLDISLCVRCTSSSKGNWEMVLQHGSLNSAGSNIIYLRFCVAELWSLLSKLHELRICGRHGGRLDLPSCHRLSFAGESDEFGGGAAMSNARDLTDDWSRRVLGRLSQQAIISCTRLELGRKGTGLPVKFTQKHLNVWRCFNASRLLSRLT